jgi:hypothetical protein
MMVDHAVFHSGKGSGVIRSVRKVDSEFATLMQTVDARRYLGKRIRLSGFVKNDSVTGWAGMWMRIDGPDSLLGFDNMHDRQITGTSDWSPYSVVLDVPTNSTSVSWGILLYGDGVCWIDDLSLQAVGDTVPPTGSAVLPVTMTREERDSLAQDQRSLYRKMRNQHYPAFPGNLDFETAEF